MRQFVVGAERDQTTLFPPCLEDWIAEDDPVRVVDAFVDALDLGALGFAGVDAAATGQPGYLQSQVDLAIIGSSDVGATIKPLFHRSMAHGVILSRTVES